MTNNIMYRGKTLSLHALRAVIFPPQSPPGLLLVPKVLLLQVKLWFQERRGLAFSLVGQGWQSQIVAGEGNDHDREASMDWMLERYGPGRMTGWKQDLESDGFLLHRHRKNN